MANPEKIKNREKESLRTCLRLMSSRTILVQQLRSVFHQHLDITLPQFDVLCVLEHANAPLRMSDISHELMVSNGNITGVIDRLVCLGLVKRERPEHDRRIQFIQLTANGLKEFNRIAELHAAWVAQQFAGLTMKEMRQLQSLLIKTKNSAVHHKLGIKDP